MKHKKGNKNFNDNINQIRYDTLFELVLSEEDYQLKQDSLQKKKRRYIEQFKTILQYHKSIKNIKNFKEYSEGLKIEI